MSLPRPSTVYEREEVVAALRANRAAGRPIFAGTGKFDRSEGTMLEWLRRADAVDRMKGIEGEVAAKTAWPKPFWENE